MEVDRAYQLFRTLRKEMAEGMKNVGYCSYSWGEHYNWTNLPALGYNCVFIHRKLTIDEKEEVLSIQKEYPGTTTIYASDTKEYTLSGEVVNFLRREPKKSKAPFLPNYSVRKFSFDHRDIKIDHHRMTESLSDYLSDSFEEKIQWERYIGGILHMMAGMIWTLENEEGNIIAAIVYSSQDNMHFLEVIGSNDKIDPKKYLLGQLIEFSFEHYGTDECFSVAVKDSWEDKLLCDLGFESTIRYKVVL